MVIFGIIVAIIVAIIVIFVISTYNSLIKMSQRVKEGFATMDVYLKKRFDLIPNLVETVKGYAAHEKSTFEEVTKARSSVANASTLEDKLQSENQLTGTLKTLFAVAEAYPELKANENFIDLQNQLKQLETDIANSRKYYNAVVREYNTSLLVFPKNIIASMFNFKEQAMFSVNNEAERETVKVSFN